MPSFADSIFLFLLALLLFGPKKLPVLARELGKWMGEFRRASNEFKMQMEEELRVSEQSERQKQIASMEAAAPIPPALDEPAEPEHPHLRHEGADLQIGDAEATAPELEASATSGDLIPPALSDPEAPAPAAVDPGPAQTITAEAAGPQTADGSRPVPIASSGSLHMMPPSTGLPVARGRGVPASNGNGALAGLVEAIPPAEEPGLSHLPASPEAESMAHGD